MHRPIEFSELRCFGPRLAKSHAAGRHIDKFWELANLALSEKSPNSRNPFVVAYDKRSTKPLCLDTPRPELKSPERPSASPNPLLIREYRTRVIEFYPDRYYRKKN